TEKAHSRIDLAPVRRSRDGHLASVHARAIAKEGNDVAIENIVTGIERQSRVGAEVDVVSPLVWRQWQVPRAPGLSAVIRVVTAHRQPEDFIRSARQVLRIVCIQGNEGLAL